MKNQSINLAKGIACIFVVFIHCQFPDKLGEYIVALGRFAVPFFALVTGYFSDFSDRKQSIEIAQKRLKGIIRLTIISSCICAFFNLIASSIGGGGVLSYLNIKIIFAFIFFNRASFLSSAMWYLFAIIYVYIIWIGALKLKKEKILFQMVPILLCINIIMQEVLKLAWYLSGNFLFTILPFFMIGNQIHNKRIKVNKKHVIGFISANILLLIEHTLLGNSFLYISSILIAVFLLIIVKDDSFIYGRKSRVYNAFCFLGDKLSMPIFVLHCGVMSIVNSIIEVFGLQVLDWMIPFIVLFFSIMLSLLWRYIENMKERKEIGLLV